MNIRSRLARLEQEKPLQDVPLFIITRYENENEAEARAAYPELSFPDKLENASFQRPRSPETISAQYPEATVWYMRRDGTRPSARPAEDEPGYDPRGLRAVLADIDGKTQTIGKWKEQAGHG